MTPRLRAAACLPPLLAATLAACGTQPAPITAATSSASTVVNTSQRGDARIAECGPGPTAEIIITNTGQAADYRIEVAYRGANGDILSVGVLTGRVEAGQTRTANAPGPAMEGALTCTLERADRS